MHVQQKTVDYTILTAMHMNVIGMQGMNTFILLSYSLKEVKVRESLHPSSVLDAGRRSLQRVVMSFSAGHMNCVKIAETRDSVLSILGQREENVASKHTSLINSKEQLLDSIKHLQLSCVCVWYKQTVFL